MPLLFNTATLNKPGGWGNNDDTVNYLQAYEGLNGWIVVDGVGEQGGGEIAAKLAADALLSGIRAESRLSGTLLLKLFASAHQVIRQRQQADASLQCMRAKVAMLLSDGHYALWAHIGNARFYLFREGRILKRTRDHSVAQELADGGQIGLADIRHHPDRHQLLRLLGAPEYSKPTLADHAELLQPNDALLLCSDDFWEYVSETAMLAELAKTDSPAGWLKGMETRLLGQAPDSHNSYSAIAIFVTSA